jgi:putative acetyltransferase
MIQKWQSNDINPLLKLWLESTIFAHPFIDERYWHESEPIVRNVYLPSAQTWVWEENGAVLGFVSVIDERFVGALFVSPQHLGRGIGRALLAQACAQYPDLSLEVYQKNTRAVNFYHAQGFRIEDSAWQDETHQPTWIMRWLADQTR